jgi:HEAT repeat protein
VPAPLPRAAAEKEAPPVALEPPAAPEMDPARQAEIEQLVRELARQRHQNRTRAESKLRALGAEAVPFLEPALRHPFNLARRAAMRLARDGGGEDAVLFAIDALTDEDIFVRQFAAETLARHGGGPAIGYNARGPERTWRASQQAWLERLAIERRIEK